MKHTPGPWFTTEYYRSAEYRKKQIVDHWVITNRKSQGQSFASVNTEEDALLIAAAPELLERLKDFVDEIDANFIGTGANDEDGSCERALIDLVKNGRKAIAKATGGVK